MTMLSYRGKGSKGAEAGLGGAPKGGGASFGGKAICSAWRCGSVRLSVASQEHMRRARRAVFGLGAMAAVVGERRWGRGEAGKMQDIWLKRPLFRAEYCCFEGEV